MFQGMPGEGPQLYIYSPCDGPLDAPDATTNGECIEASIECTSNRIETSIKISEETLGRWISSENEFASELTIGNAKTIVVRPYAIALDEESGTWVVDSMSDPNINLPREPGTITMDIGIDALVVSATGRNLQEVKTLIERCAKPANHHTETNRPTEK
jgi:hypothetical protein